MPEIFALSCGFAMIFAAIGFGGVVFVPLLDPPVVVVVDPPVADEPLEVGVVACFSEDGFDEVVAVGLPVGCWPAVGGLSALAYAGEIARQTDAVIPRSTCRERMDPSTSARWQGWYPARRGQTYAVPCNGTPGARQDCLLVTLFAGARDRLAARRRCYARRDATRTA